VSTLRALALVLLAGALLPSAAQAADRPPRCPVDVPSAIVIEVSTGTVACATNPNEHRPIASTTKLMTALLTLERAKLSDVYTASDYRPSPAESQIGLDPAFTIDAFRTLIGSDRSQIKGLLRDQSKIAGIGNAYSDDTLHAAKLSPFKSAANLDDAEVQRLYDAIESVLSDAVERARGHAAGELKAEKKLGMRVHGRSGQPCPVCGDTVRSVSFADSSLDYCPTCQTGGKPLADRRLSRLLK